MITHGNIVATTAAVRPVIPRLGRNDVYLAYLPLAHVLELVAEVSSYPVYLLPINVIGITLTFLCSPVIDVVRGLCNRLWFNFDTNRHF